MIGTNENRVIRRIKWWREYQVRQMLSPWNQSGMSLLWFLPTVRQRNGPMEILLGNGRIIRIRPGFHSESLRQLLAVVEDSSCG